MKLTNCYKKDVDFTPSEMYVVYPYQKCTWYIHTDLQNIEHTKQGTQVHISQ